MFFNPRGIKDLAQGGGRSGILFNATNRKDWFGLYSGGRSAWNNSFSGALAFAVPFAVLNATQANRGESFSTGVSSFAGMTLSAIPGAMLGGTMGAFISQAVLSGPIERKIKRGLDWVQKRGNRRPKMGGNYQDFDAAYTMRQVAVREIGNSLSNARPYLGKEGALMHQ